MHFDSSNWNLAIVEEEVTFLCRKFKLLSRWHPALENTRQYFVDKVKIGNCIGTIKETKHHGWMVLTSPKHDATGQYTISGQITVGLIHKGYALDHLLRNNLHRGTKPC